MNCLTYARVSTDKQAEKELSIPAQLQAMRQYADERGWHIREGFVEPGASARSADRPVLRQLLERSRQGIDVVLVHKLDRLARNLTDHTMIQALLRRNGVRLVSLAENLDDSVSGHLVEHVMRLRSSSRLTWQRKQRRGCDRRSCRAVGPTFPPAAIWRFGKDSNRRLLSIPLRGL